MILLDAVHFLIHKIKKIIQFSLILSILFQHVVFAQEVKTQVNVPNKNSENVNQKIDQKSVSKNEKVFVRDMKMFRIIQKRDSLLVLNKVPGDLKSLVYTKGLSTLSIQQNKDVTLYQMMMPGKNKRHYLLYKLEKGQQPKVAYYNIPRSTYYSSALDQDNLMCNMRNAFSIKDLQLINFELKGAAENPVDTFDLDNVVKNCDEENQALLVSTVSDLFNNNAKKLFSCLEKQETLDALKKPENQFLLGNVNLFVARMIRMMPSEKVDNFKESGVRSPLQSKDKKINQFTFSCKMENGEEKRNASYKDDLENPLVSINFDLLKDIKDEAEKKKKIKSLLMHEFYHSSSQQIQMKDDPTKMDEFVVQSMEGLCGEDKIKNDKVENSKGVNTSAVARVDESVDSRNLKAEAILNIDTQKVSSTSIQETQGATAQIIETEFANVTNAALQSGITDGSGGLANNNSIGKLTAAIETSERSMAGTLSQIAAQTVLPQAQASTQSNASNSSSYASAQVLRDQFQGLTATPTEVPSAVSAKMTSLSTGNAAESGRRTPAAESFEPKPNSPTVADVKPRADMANKNAVNPALSQVDQSVAGPEVSDKNFSNAPKSDKVPSTSVRAVKGSMKPTSQIPSITTLPTGAVESDSPTIQVANSNTTSIVSNNNESYVRSLTAFSNISGNTYNAIKPKLSDPKFVETLSTNGIQIQRLDKTIIGTKNNPKIRFKETTNGLVKEGQ